jgi:hypothetical protein
MNYTLFSLEWLCYRLVVKGPNANRAVGAGRGDQTTRGAERYVPDTAKESALMCLNGLCGGFAVECPKTDGAVLAA